MRTEEAAPKAAGADQERPIALIAGAGDLPLSVAQSLRARAKPVFVVSVAGETDRDYSAFPHIKLTMGAASQLLKSLRDNGCTDVMIAGAFRRPRFSDITFDLGSMKLALSSILRLRFGGDDAVVNGVVRIFEAEGFRVVGPEEVVPEMIAAAGPLGRLRPSRPAREDVETGVAAIVQMAPLDIGQAVIVLDRRIVAVEAAEGTTGMIERCGTLRDIGRINVPAPSGVLVKMPKPGQETRLEMPVIGPDTVRAAASAGLLGIAVAAGGVIIVDGAAVARLADEAGLFVFGFKAPLRDG